ncbi:MAG TPA: hypothetical protein VK206_04735, partial [Anaerolineales bacterium]|nr:hypothetical protein [Anaerolineales bacterium]
MSRDRNRSSHTRRIYGWLALLTLIITLTIVILNVQRSNNQPIRQNVTIGTIIASPFPTASSPTSVVAFPGAEGFGAQSVGGRGGKVIEVTNLNDSGPGSLRACAAAQGPRICVFRTGGTITTQSEIVVTNPFLTIAGQTAPGGGITLRASQSYTGETLVISTHDVIIRYVRFRAGASALANSVRRSLTLNNGGYNIILDHDSLSWATDQPLLLI